MEHLSSLLTLPLRFLITIIAISLLLKMGIDHLPNGATFDQFAFGAVDPRTYISNMPRDVITNAVIANTPQLFLSFLYFSYNALFTAMLMGYEWLSYSRKRKGLRVSRQPSGAQRSTYFLQLPYRFGIPLMVLSGTLHWLVSQSIFLVAIDFYDTFGNPGSAWSCGLGYKTLGYSPPAMASVIVLAGIMVISIIAFGYIPYKRGMPLAGTCSMAISAACHPAVRVEDGNSIAEQKLKWGVVSTGVDGLGHCAFSAGNVGAIVKGRLYGGIST
ncbi:hypothetical protein AA0113_g682 [Alternaria arborescens]|uniref:Uncharacterized protein n=1 Tax=Alternaria arborescens TaxID=156630 RepID=A0A4Q4SPI2_9PLEO|nr:hypothetical protein AA0111_g10136 [Alternaria arborescens]RYN29959.1 hypothetical protein AA0112_g7057 [Alternaria arborescens]RYO20477.1 hypothetical protein AA0111_g10136 [Alternaria arborescens]RYO72815.1 hypothetical protein AA0113_g682 [Alternaria arborescens]